MRDLLRCTADFEREYATKEEWVRESMLARQRLEKLTEMVTRIETELENGQGLAAEIGRAGSALQMSLFGEETLGQPVMGSESPTQRLAWERRLLGYPVSGLREPLKPVAERLPEHTPLHRLPEMPGRSIPVAGVRLPGWTGGEGFYLWDGATWAIVKGLEKTPASWEPLLLRGRWAVDEWGMGWLQATSNPSEATSLVLFGTGTIGLAWFGRAALKK